MNFHLTDRVVLLLPGEYPLWVSQQPVEGAVEVEDGLGVDHQLPGRAKGGVAAGSVHLDARGEVLWKKRQANKCFFGNVKSGLVSISRKSSF